MKGDYSRFTFRPLKRYSGVRMQQGRVQLDADWNEQLDIAHHLRRALTTDLIGVSGASGVGAFQVSVAGNEIRIGAGRFYLDGILCDNPAQVAIDQQPDLPSYVLPTADGFYVAYLDVWERQVTALEDPDLLELALGGPDTTTRTRTVWQVRLLALTGATPGCSDFTPDWTAGGEPAGTLAARTVSAVPDNRLYRVEVHQGGTLGNATFKWSRDNGTVAARIANPSLFQIQILAQVGQDTAGGFAAGQWVEVTDDGRVLRGEPGTFARVAAASGQVLTVEGWPLTTDPAPDLPAVPVVRRWDSDGGTSGEVTVAVPATNDGYLPLEDGLEIRFGNDTTAFYRPGDAWVIPTRAQAGVLWSLGSGGLPVFATPHFVRHHFASLAVLEKSGNTWALRDDCRATFQPVTVQPGPEKVNRTGDTMTGPLEIQSGLTVTGMTQLGGSVPANQVSVEVESGALKLAAGAAEGGLELGPVTTAATDRATLRYSGDDTEQRLRLAVTAGGATDASVLSLSQAGSDLLNLAGGRVGVGTDEPAADFHVDVTNTLFDVPVNGELRIAGPLAIVEGTQGEGKVLTSDANGRVRWEELPERALGVPMFLTNPLEVVSSSGQTGGWLTYNIDPSKVPATASAVILQGLAAMNGPDSGDTYAHIFIRAGTDEPALLLLRGRAAGGGDAVAWGGQGLFPIKDSKFQYLVDSPGFAQGFQIQLVGYFP